MWCVVVVVCGVCVWVCVCGGGGGGVGGVVVWWCVRVVAWCGVCVCVCVGRGRCVCVVMVVVRVVVVLSCIGQAHASVPGALQAYMNLKRRAPVYPDSR